MLANNMFRALTCRFRPLIGNFRRCLSDTTVEVKYLKRGQDAIAYRVIPGDSPGIVFCPGFQSNMMGVKGNAMEEYCKRKGLAYVR